MSALPLTLAASLGEQRTATEGGSGWTDERMDLAAKLWKHGLSASQIAKRLGGVSRNAVIGKLHRMGLAGESPNSARAKPSAPSRTKRVFSATRAKPQQPHVVTRPPVPLPPFAHDEPGSVTILTLGAHMCRWPIGDPQDAAFTLCGARTGGIYCAAHAARAYQPTKAQAKAPERWGVGHGRFASA